jgi:hypothetical protein
MIQLHLLLPFLFFFVALAFAVPCSFLLPLILPLPVFFVIPQRSGGICFSHLLLPLLLR